MIREKLKSIFFEEVDEVDNRTIKEKFIDFIKNPQEIISFFLPIIIALILIIPVPYTVTIGGGTINIDEKIEIEDSYKSNGSFNSAYVKELQGRVITYLLAKVIPSYELTPIKDVILDNESQEDYNYREKNFFATSIDSATIVAYTKANKKIEIKEQKILVLYIFKEAKTDLKVGDQIIEINNQKVSDIDSIREIVSRYDYIEEISIKVLRNDKEVDCYCNIINIDDSSKIGIYLNTEYSYNTSPKIDFSFNNRESGPSGGLMLTLSIYNKLVKEDITGGKKIVGTGTIDPEGNVGEIGGVKEKLVGAVKSKADIFIVPKENYDETLAIKEQFNYNIELLSVSTFDEALIKLKEYVK